MKGLGLNSDIISLLDKDLAIRRIQKDVQSDFIFAPHVNVIYHQSSDELFDTLAAQLRAGRYNTRLPISIDVIKPNGFHRTGSILEPLDRLAYQSVVDLISIKAEGVLDRRQVFSQKLLFDDPDGFMFEKSNDSYLAFKTHIADLCRSGQYRYALRSDIASYFDRIYQHVLGNQLYSTGAEKDAVSFLEKFLLQLSQNDSHGIIQGLFPSDFLGNFCLCVIDAQHSLQNLEFARYVDDMYIFFSDLNEARKHKVVLANWLKKEGLTLNESKTRIYEVANLLHEETEIDQMFEDAKHEVESDSSELFYSTNIFWNLESEVATGEKNIELDATKKLFDSIRGEEIDTQNDASQKIQRFCLPVFSAFDDDYAVDYVLRSFPYNPNMAQVYFTYLSKMIVAKKMKCQDIEKIFEHRNMIFDYQRMWLYSTLLFAENVSSGTIRMALSDLTKQVMNPGHRSICAILASKYGSVAERQIIKSHYSNENAEFVKSAILYAAQYFPKSQRDTCFNAWSGHNETNSLIVAGLKKGKIS